MSKKLVAYFSASGTTARAAEALADAVGAVLHEIQPATPYTQADLNWQDVKSRSSMEMKNLQSRPEIANRVDHMEDHDVIFLGFPIWWFVAPTIINTFLEGYDLSGKTIILFATSGGSGFGDTVKHLKGSVSDTTVIKEGRILNGPLHRDDLKAWADGLDL